MQIRRSKLTRDYLQVPNRTARDDRLSHMARGILVEILSHQDGWETTADDMWRKSFERHGKASPGRRQFRAAFAELKAAGYMVPQREKLDGGKYGTVLVVSDVPQGGTSVRPAKIPKSDEPSDVPHGGTSEPPADMRETAGQPDVPDVGTSEPPAPTEETAGHADVPHGGTSKRENGEKTHHPKTAPAHGCGPKPSEPQRTTAHPSLRSGRLLSGQKVDHLPAEDPLPAVRTATIPGDDHDRAGVEESAAELQHQREIHNQGCARCQNGRGACTTGADLAHRWMRAFNREAS